jgi:hypothetical protein
MKNMSAESSPAIQPPPKYRTGNNLNYRRYREFFSLNIGGFEENFRRFNSFGGQL